MGCSVILALRIYHITPCLTYYRLSPESQETSGQLFAGLFWLNFKIIAIFLNRCHFTDEMVTCFKIASVDLSLAGLCHRCARRCL